MAYFANILAEPKTILKKFDFSSCWLNDKGLIYLINALQSNKNIRSMKVSDNFFTENIETLLLETLNKNTTLTEIGIDGNRFSYSCLQRVKLISKRNLEMIEEHEPNKLKAEIYQLRDENKKLQTAKKLLKE